MNFEQLVLESLSDEQLKQWRLSLQPGDTVIWHPQLQYSNNPEWGKPKPAIFYSYIKHRNGYGYPGGKVGDSWVSPEDNYWEYLTDEKDFEWYASFEYQSNLNEYKGKWIGTREPLNQLFPTGKQRAMIHGASEEEAEGISKI